MSDIAQNKLSCNFYIWKYHTSVLQREVDYLSIQALNEITWVIRMQLAADEAFI